MPSPFTWSPADSTALAWLTGAAIDGGATGYNVGPMPDRVFVLHPLTERVDGEKTNAGYPEDSDGWPEDSGPEPATRTLQWREYAHRRDIPMLTLPYWPGLIGSLPGVWEDDYVEPPAEGELADPSTRDALLAVLERHTAGGGDQFCTALYNDFWLRGAPHADRPALPHILRGPLGTGLELFDRTGKHENARARLGAAASGLRPTIWRHGSRRSSHRRRNCCLCSGDGLRRRLWHKQLGCSTAQSVWHHVVDRRRGSDADRRLEIGPHRHERQRRQRHLPAADVRM